MSITVLAYVLKLEMHEDRMIYVDMLEIYFFEKIMLLAFKMLK